MAQQVLERTADAAERSLRSELARELHDRVTQPLTAMLLELEEFKRTPHDPRTARRRISSFQRQTREALDEIREVLCELRDQERLDAGLVARLRGELEARKLRYPGLEIALAVSAEWPASMPARCAEHLLRIVLEAFENARLHGGATRIEVALRVLRGGLAEVSVSDNGRGLREPPAPLRAGMGLTGMHERAILLGGRLVLDNRPGGGTRARVQFEREVVG